MTLYELTTQYQALLELAEDPDVDPEVLADTMDGLDGDIEEKADGYAKVIKCLETQAAGVKAELDRLSSRKKSIETNIARIKGNLEAAMRITGKVKFKTPLFSFGIRKNPASVVIDEPYVENIPARFLIPQEPAIDKKAMTDALKAGEDLTGICHLEQSESLSIR